MSDKEVSSIKKRKWGTDVDVFGEVKDEVENKTVALSTDKPNPEKDPVELAQEAAARIAKQLESRLAQKSEEVTSADSSSHKKPQEASDLGTQHTTASSHSSKEFSSVKASAASSTTTSQITSNKKEKTPEEIAREIADRIAQERLGKTADGGAEYVREIEINDVPHRASMSKTQYTSLVEKETKAVLTVKGRYFEDPSKCPLNERPLYIRIVGPTQEVVDAAAKRVKEIGEFGADSLYSTKLYIDIAGDHIFNVKQRILGQGGAYVKQIQRESGAKVFLRGRGVDPNDDEPLHLKISARYPDAVDRGLKQCEELLEAVRNDWNKHRRQMVETGGKPAQPQIVPSAQFPLMGVSHAQMVQPMQAGNPGQTASMTPQMMAAFQQQMMLGYAPHTMGMSTQVPNASPMAQFPGYAPPAVAQVNGGTSAAPQQAAPTAGTQPVAPNAAGMDPAQMAAYTAAYGAWGYPYGYYPGYPPYWGYPAQTMAPPASVPALAPQSNTSTTAEATAGSNAENKS